ncbi:hypothetical protein BCON_0629g00010 [Botryotinia convoluta]|uniref:Heterokaryon incompatibility domain-containing protein n=1 Tax=Botryotinia convoluta TaxID=54673 RepID=A0A4Z1H7I5_9HELO|nr:hypothetical protein BCON_0629g00010 [Botryotinia convoluta]
MKVDIVGLESYFEIASSTGSDQSLKLSKQWLKNCNDSHDACRRRNSTVGNILPTRLIEIGAGGLVLTLRLCLRKDVPINAVYFTLSHCWGKVSPKLVLLQSNEERMLRGIDFLQLSKTFQDALWVVRQLGGQYIWIDSLCIVQDSKADWLRESAKMCDVYSNSFCNICATAARNGNEGMFRDRNLLQVKQDKLVAIGGLAATAHRTIGGRYFAGLWENQLPSGLLWATLDISDPSKFAVLGSGTQECIAPSWSWASLNAEINFPLARRGTGDIEIYCQILEAHVDLTSDNLLGQISGAYIKVKGELAPAHVHHKQVSLFSQNHESKPLSPFEKILYWDYEDMSALELIDSLYLLPVCKSIIQEDQWQIGGLILVPTGKVDWELRRCGMFSYSDDESHRDLKSVCETFRKGFEDWKLSELGMQDDGEFVINML